MLRRLVNIMNWTHVALVLFAKALLILMVVIIFINVVLRYGFSSGLQWSEEISLVIAIWFTFISMVVGVKQHLHIHINILPQGKIPPKLDAALWNLRDLIIIIVGVTFLVWGTNLVKFGMLSILPVTKIPVGFGYLVIPISGLLLTYEGVTDLFNVDTEDKKVDDYLSGTSGPIQKSSSIQNSGSTQNSESREAIRVV